LTPALKWVQLVVLTLLRPSIVNGYPCEFKGQRVSAVKSMGLPANQAQNLLNWNVEDWNVREWEPPVATAGRATGNNQKHY